MKKQDKNSIGENKESIDKNINDIKSEVNKVATKDDIEKLEGEVYKELSKDKSKYEYQDDLPDTLIENTQYIVEELIDVSSIKKERIKNIVLVLLTLIAISLSINLYINRDRGIPNEYIIEKNNNAVSVRDYNARMPLVIRNNGITLIDDDLMVKISVMNDETLQITEAEDLSIMDELLENGGLDANSIKKIKETLIKLMEQPFLEEQYVENNGYLYSKPKDLLMDGTRIKFYVIADDIPEETNDIDEGNEINEDVNNDQDLDSEQIDEKDNTEDSSNTE